MSFQFLSLGNFCKRTDCSHYRCEEISISSAYTRCPVWILVSFVGPHCMVDLCSCAILCSIQKPTVFKRKLTMARTSCIVFAKISFYLVSKHGTNLHQSYHLEQTFTLLAIFKWQIQWRGITAKNETNLQHDSAWKSSNSNDLELSFWLFRIFATDVSSHFREKKKYPSMIAPLLRLFEPSGLFGPGQHLISLFFLLNILERRFVGSTLEARLLW